MASVSVTASDNFENIDGVPLLTTDYYETTSACFEFSVQSVSVFFKKWELVLGATAFVILLWKLAHQEFLYYHQIVLLSLTSAYLIYRIVYNIKSESLLVVAPLGLQLTVTYKLGNQTSTYIPWFAVKDVLINEAITLHRVVYYLAVLVEYCERGVAKQRLIPLFQHTTPRLLLLERIYKRVQEQLQTISNKKE